MSLVSIVPPTSETVDNIYLPDTSHSFELQYEGNAFHQNSLRVQGELLVELANGNAITKDTNVLLDPKIGISCLFRQVTSELNGQVLEQINDYPTYVKALFEARTYEWDYVSQSDRNLSLMTASESIMPAFLARNTDTGTPGNNLKVYVPFSVPLYNLTNSSDDDISSQKGIQKITIMLNQVTKGLYGSDVATCTYQIRNLKLKYIQVSDNGNKAVVCRKKTIIERPLTTDNAQYSISTPLVVNAISCVFKDKTIDNTDNNYTLQSLPNLQRVAFDFNNDNQRPIEYDLTNLVEWLSNYKDSWGLPIRSNDDFSLLDYYANGENFGIGLNFNEAVDLSKNHWQMNIQSGVSNARPMVCIMIFHGEVVL